jgi:hypothetical protein
MAMLTRGDVAVFFRLAGVIANAMLQALVDRRPGGQKTLLAAVKNGDATLEIRVKAPSGELELFACVEGLDPKLLGSIEPDANWRSMRVN